MTGSPLPMVHVVDDDDSLREALERRLRVQGYAVRSYASADRFLADYEPGGEIACILLDVQMPGMGGLDLQGALADRGIGLPIVFLTSHGDVPMSVKALKAGAENFLMKPARDEALMAAVEAALARARERHAGEAKLAQARQRFSLLSAREREILALVASGLPNKLVADRTGLALVTVKVHRANVMRKMGADSLADLVRLATLLE